jgi:uncharacterized protein (DUF1810 family)
MEHGYNLQRFVEAQQGVYERVVEELQAGRKRSHWMWFIFPQIAGLGHSGMAQKFAIGSLAEAEAYAKHAGLGARLRECTQLVLNIEGRAIEEIFGYPDDLKFRSSMTLFREADPSCELYAAALAKFFDGAADERTLGILGKR